MSKTYLEQFKEKYNFLEKYGFTLADDPCTSERLCYKNAFGEIVLWTKDNFGIFSPLQLYVQINGWKTEIDVVSEYKKHISKYAMFVPYEKKVEKLFELMVRKNKEFYGLKILDNKFRPYPKITSEPIKNKEVSNPIQIARDRSNLLRVIIVSMIILFAQLISLFSFEYLKTFNSVYIIKTLVYLSMLLPGLIIVFSCRKYFNLFSKFYLLIYPISLLVLLNHFPRRVDYIIYMIFFIFSIVYALIYILRYKIKDKKGMSNGLVTCIYPTIVAFIKAFELNDYMFFINMKYVPYVIVGIIASVICLILYCVYRKDRSNKKDYIGGLFASLLCSLLVTVVTPIITLQSLNYTLDTSEGIVKNYQIVDKDTRYSSGRYRHLNYYLTIILNGKEEEINVESHIYYSYDIYDYIELEYHEGFMGYSYYEYVVSD